MDDSAQEKEPQVVLAESNERLKLQVEDWEKVVKDLLLKQFGTTQKFVNHVTDKLQKQLPADVLEMQGEEFVEKYFDASTIKDEPDKENIGNQTLATLDHIEYLMNSSHHDAETKEVAAKLQKFILSKK